MAITGLRAPARPGFCTASVVATTTFVISLCAAGIASADIDPKEYAAPGAVTPSKPPQQLRAEVEAEIEAERRREAERVQAEQEATRQRERELAARPLAVRLLESRCTSCHEPAYYEDREHTRVGWELVILRMQWLNGAELGAGERGIIAAHLAEKRPASMVRVLFDAAVVLSPIAIAALSVLAWRGWRRRRRSLSV